MTKLDSRFSLTLTQEDIYFDQVKNINSPLYNVGGYIDIAEVCLERLTECHKKLVNSNDTFGIRLKLTKEGISQFISADRKTELPLIDFSSTANPCEEADRWLKQLFEEPLEIIEKELFKAFIIKLSDKSHRYVGFAHHLAMDGWGFANWANKLGQLYNDLPVEFDSAKTWREVVSGDRAYLDSKKFSLAKEYWSEYKLSGSTFLEPYYQSKFNLQKSIPSNRKISTIDQNLFVKLQQCAKNSSVGISHVLLAAFTAYFSLAYSKDTLTVGLPFHNRKNFMQKNMLGVFTSVSPLKIDIEYESEFIELVKEICRRQKAHFRHQRYPISYLVKSQQEHARDQRLFDIGFNYLKLDSHLSFEGQDAHLVYLSHNHEATPVMLTAWQYGDQQNIELQLDYNLAYLDERESKQLLARFTKVLTQALSNPKIAISSIDILLAEEQNSPTPLLNDLEPYETVISLFERQVIKSPEAVAVSYQTNSLTYQQLNNRANHLSQKLRSLGIKPGDRIGIHLNRSANLLTAIIAILKCGAAYVPLDPTYPEQRLKFFVEDSGLKIVLTHREREFSGANNLVIENFLEHVDDKVLATSLDVKPTSEDLAYLIYTSGSTGVPKAVKVTHSNVYSLITWAEEYFNRAELEKVLASTSLNFDISIFELLVPIALGHESVIVENALSLLTDSPNITLVNSVPSALRTLVENNSIPKSVITINSAGEQLPLDLLNQLLQFKSVQSVNNLYGPTEDTVYSTCKKFTQRENSQPTIGQPIKGTQAYIISDIGNRVPQGVAGELVLCGDGITKGYFNRDELTAERFVENRFDVSSQNMYKTGDVVRQLSNGEIQYFGRKDQQIKIRGYRIELSEVEHHLAQIKEVEAAVVTAYENSQHSHTIAAYITTKDKSDITVARKREIQQELALCLPNYMIPSEFAVLDNFPLNNNGKIDRKQLPKIEQHKQSDTFHPATTPTEKTLAHIWGNLFRIEPESIDITIDFFASGGHSLLAVKYGAQISEQIDRSLPLDVVFKFSSIKSLADQIDNENLSDELPEITSIARDQDNFPVSQAQSRLWFLSKMGDTSIHYNMPVALKFHGKFELSRAEQSINKVIARHVSLQTYFQETLGVASQRINPDFRLSLTQYDLTSMGSEEQQKQLTQLISANTEYRFKLTQQVALMGAYVLLSRQGENNIGVLLLNFHHIISDGASLKIFAQEFAHFYHHASVDSGTSEVPVEPEPKLDFQYIDYPNWLSICQKSKQYQRQLEYWKNQLADAPPIHTLPLDKIRPQTKCFRGALLTSKISKERIDKLAVRFAVSPFMLVHGILALVFSSHSNSNDIVVGTPSANRLKQGFQNVIGLFVNTLVLRTRTNFENLIEYFQHVKKVHVEAQANQLVQFDDILNELKVETTSTYNPLFQIMLSLEDNIVEELNIPEIQFEILENSPVTAKFDLDISVAFSTDKLILNWIYDLSLFEEDRILSISSHFSNIVSEIEKSTDESILSLNMLSKGELTEIHQQFNRLNISGTTLVGQSTITAFENIVNRYPENISVVFEGSKLSYSELNNQAENLSRMLASRGVKSGCVVGVALDRSLLLLVTIIAIHKLRAAYLPLDLSLPRNRLKYMIEDSGASHLIVTATSENCFNWLESRSFKNDKEFSTNELKKANTCLKVVIEEADTASFANEKVAAQIETVESKLNKDLSPAYVIYTSGTSGKPKGVVVDNKALALHIGSVIDYFRFTQDDSVLQIAAFTFDTFIEQVFAALCTGASIVLAKNSLLKPDHFFKLAKENNVTITDVSVAYLEELTHEDWREYWDKTSITRVVVGGEALGSGLVNRWLNRSYLNKRKLFNAYGPTEAVVSTTYREISVSDRDLVGLGNPLAHRELLVLDCNQRLVPLGSIGELFIGGDCLATKYINDNELTAEKFIDKKFPYAQSRRWYKTGDLVGYTREGKLFFAGRADQQVKIRGFRIELEEIECLLNQSNLVNSCVVSMRATGKSSEHIRNLLVAYFRPIDNNKDVSEEAYNQQLKEYVQRHLPEYMVPELFVRIENWPLTVNGKIDRRALPEPNLAAQEMVKPKSLLEFELAELWSELLEVNPTDIGVNSSFFELGGNSLLVLRLLARIRVSYQRDIEIVDFFAQPNIKHLAELISTNSGAVKECFWPLMKYSKANPQHDAPLVDKSTLTSAQQKRFWLLDQLTEGQNGAYNLYQSFNISGELNSKLVKNAFEIILERHHVLSSTFSYDQGDVFQKLNISSDIPFVEIDLSLSEQKSEAIEQLLIESSQYQFKLEAEIPIRVLLVKLEDESHVLQVVVHHIAIDGWSVRILIEEFSQIYSLLLQTSDAVDGLAFKRSLNQKLSLIEYQYSDYALSQRDAFAENNSIFAHKLEFWQKELENAPQCHEIPLDAPRPEKQTFSGGMHTTFIGADEFNNVSKICGENEVTLNMLMHAAFSTFVSRYSNSNESVIGIPVANRLHSEVETIIGCFVNTLPIRLSLQSGMSFREMLQQTKKKYVGALSNQDLPFEVIVESLAIPRNANFSPVFQIMMVFHNNQESELELSGAAINQRKSDVYSAKFDLTLNITEVASRLRLDWEFNTDLFELKTIERLSNLFISLTKKLAANLDTNLFSIPLVNEVSPELAKMNRTKTELEALTLAELFNKSATQYATSIAVRDGEKQFTYSELNEKILSFCCWLKSNNVVAGDKVLVLLEHSVDMLISILAMSKVGVCFVPVDPQSPLSRLKQIAQDADAKFLLDVKKKENAAEIEKHLGLSYLDIGDFHPNDIPQQEISAEVSPEATAYILFTSGSTGQPKGVEVSNLSLANFLLSMRKEPGFSNKDRLLAVTPLTFDISLLELFLPLISGAQVILDGIKFAKDGEELASLIDKHRITVMQATPALWQLLVSSGWKGAPDLKILCGGESLNRELANKLCERAKSVWNMYGPTETTIWSTCAQISAHPETDLISVGKPIANTSIYLLDQEMNIVPDGVVGQIYIEGAGIAKGYVNRPDLTSVAFINKSIEIESAISAKCSRLYATGDLGKISSDGQLIHLGRMDHQIKLNGFRIEPGDIESALNQHPNIDDSLVVIDTNPGGGSRLVAYYVLYQNTPSQIDSSKPTHPSLREFLAQFLPAYMLPNVYMEIDKFPLTRSGKRDRQALPKVVLERASLTNKYVKPKDELQTFLVNQIQSITSIENVGIDDNFFEIGMTSMDIVAVATALSNRLKRKVSPVDFFINPTILGLVKNLTKADEFMTVLEQRKKGISKAKARLRNRMSRNAR